MQIAESYHINTNNNKLQKRATKLNEKQCIISSYQTTEEPGSIFSLVLFGVTRRTREYISTLRTDDFRDRKTRQARLR